ncbi:hypothetical protein TELCIR_17564, partial [Teladorsagia circumcincta]
MGRWPPPRVITGDRFQRPVERPIQRSTTMSLDVEDRTEDIQNNNRRVKPVVQFVDPAKRCHYCGREGKKPEAEKKRPTMEGFATWMFQGLTFLLPFLVVMYLLELNNAYTLYKLWKTQKCAWQ